MDKELKRMSRKDLLEILISQMEENERLNAELEELRELVNVRKIVAGSTGTLAEAALKLNGVFEAADAAARQYLENVTGDIEGAKALYSTNAAEKTAAERQAVSYADGDVAEELRLARLEAEAIIADAKLQSEKIISEADAYWQETLKKARVLLKKA